MDGEPAVSVIVPTYNRSQVLRLALSSILNQDFTDYEVWVVGDGCTDDSAEVTQSFADSRIHWVSLPRNTGSQAFANNEGIAHARGKYIAHLGHDDLWMPWHLSRLVAFIEETGADVVHPLAALIGPEGIRESVGPPRPNVPQRRHRVPPSLWLLRRSIVDATGLWSDPAKINDAVDANYWQRMNDAGARVSFLPELSVLKFPSPWFKEVYRNSEIPVQEKYWAQVRSDPNRLREQALLELAVHNARLTWGGDEPVLSAFKNAVRVLLRRIVDIAGRDHGVAAALMRRRIKDRTRKTRRIRGLPDL